MLGPTLNNQNSYEDLRDKLDQRQLSIPLKHAVLKHLDALPIIASNIFFEYAIMLHYCLTGERITSKEFAHPSESLKTVEEEVNGSFTKEHNGIWQSEQQASYHAAGGEP